LFFFNAGFAAMTHFDRFPDCKAFVDKEVYEAFTKSNALVAQKYRRERVSFGPVAVFRR
jgi:hypothetical protein